ncbi:glycosyltransferase 87 family protein [Rhodovulum tesquicola]|uniref:glycosyltransferase 87 family protein n=1 Tax=Rhodovulum tesquicola TaxID=540254 RepID=UPI002096D952|nr:glycosyltransferase 87 family protein [Rhodovulum tesquicola]MCO8145289.1 glycosyltransferase 87 family protein [Rhodovulum tesquicola]
MFRTRTATAPPPLSASILRAAPIVLGMTVLGLAILGFLDIPRISGDLLPLWLAGQAFAEGAPGEVYAPVEPVFRMLPPDSWAERARAAGYEGFIYPFVYPPLWAWVFGLIGRIADFQTLAGLASIVNPALLLATCLLAWRASGAAQGVVVHVVIALALLLMTPVGRIAIMQNQAQILVAFLVVLALERTRANRPVSAGAALALAASIKLFPAIFALFWLASGERRAFAAFAAMGLGLGLMSLAVAGWPLHAEFLGHVASIGRTGFFSPLSFSLDGVLAKYMTGAPIEVLLGHTAPGAEVPRRITVAEKGPALVLSGQAALLLLTASFAWAMARARQTTRNAALWPAALTLFPLIGPIAWSYYFIAATAFAPTLLSRLGMARGAAVLIVVFGPIHVWALPGMQALGTDFQRLGAVLFLILGLAFLVAARAGPERSGKT